MSDIYLSRRDYDAVVDAILGLPVPLLKLLSVGLATADDVKIAVGEYGDVWPSSLHPETGGTAGPDQNCDNNPRAFPREVCI